MFETITASHGDSLLALMGAYRADLRPHKMDVGVGVYRDENGATPVMTAVKAAEARVLASQESKAYLGLVGNADFNAAIVTLVLGDDGGATRNNKRLAAAARCAHCSIWSRWHDPRLAFD